MKAAISCSSSPHAGERDVAASCAICSQQSTTCTAPSSSTGASPHCTPQLHTHVHINISIHIHIHISTFIGTFTSTYKWLGCKFREQGPAGRELFAAAPQLPLSDQYVHSLLLSPQCSAGSNGGRCNLRLLGDFGRSVSSLAAAQKRIVLRTQCGNPAYAAPEVLAHEPYCAEADVCWALELNSFALLCSH